MKKRHHQNNHYLLRWRMHLNIRRLGSPVRGLKLRTLIKPLEDSRKWMEERAPEWRPGGADRPHHQAGRPPPLGLFKQPLPTKFFAHTPAQKISPSSICSAASRERKLRKRVEKKSKGSLSPNFSLTALKALGTMFGRIVRGTSSRANSQRLMSVDSQESTSPVSNPSPSTSQSQGKILTNDVHLHTRRGEQKERYEKLKKCSFVLTPMLSEEFMQEAGLNSFYHTSERGFLLFTLGSFAL
jgi:hypothetical protein